MENFILKGFFTKVFLMIPGSNDLMLPLTNYFNKVKSSRLRVKEIDPNNFKDKSIPRDLRDTIIKKCFQWVQYILPLIFLESVVIETWPVFFSRDENVGDKMEKLFRLVENLKGEIAEQRKASETKSLLDSGSRPGFLRNKSMDSIFSSPPISAEIYSGSKASFGSEIRKRTHPKISETDQE